MSAKNKNSEPKNKAAVNSEKKSTPDFFDALGNKAIWLGVGIITLIAFIVFKDFLLQKKIYFFKDIGSDSSNECWPWMVHSANYIAKYGIPSWSFNLGMGQNMLSFSFYDPFDYIIYLFGGQAVPHLIVYKEFAKIVIAGFLFFKYLKLLNISNYTSIIGSMLFTFCGFTLLSSSWFFTFSFEVVMAALLLYCFELLFQKNKWQWFILPVFLIGISRPFNFWLYAIFFAPYILFRFYQENENLNIRQLSILLGKIIGISILGIGLSAPLLIEHIQVMVDSPRGSGPDSYTHILASAPMLQTIDKIQLGTGIMRMFSNDILGSGINFKGWQNLLEAPAFYCGLPCLLLFTQLFHFLNKPVKRMAILLLVLWVIPFIFPYFRHAFWLFTGDYYRTYSFFVSIILIFYTTFSLDKILEQHKINKLNLGITLIVLLILINYSYFPDEKMIDAKIRFFAEVFLIIYAVILYYMAEKKENFTYKVIFIGLLFIELSYFSWCTVNRRDVVSAKDLSNKIGYNDYSIEALNFVKQSDNSFYRIDKTYGSTPAIHSSLNDGMAQDYYGTSSYNSFNQKYYINYLKTMGVLSKVNELESRWASGLINRFILESLNDVKYVFSKHGYAQPSWHVTHDSIARFGDVLVLKNKFNVPLGFTYQNYMALSDFEKLSPLQKDFMSTKTSVVNDDDVSKVSSLHKISLQDTLSPNQFTFEVLKQNIDSLKQNTLQITEFAPTKIKGAINTPANTMLYLSIPFDKGWSASDNGKTIDEFILSNGMTGLLLEKGNHNIELTYTSLNLKRGMYLFVVSILVFIGTVFFFRKKTINFQQEN